MNQMSTVPFPDLMPAAQNLITSLKEPAVSKRRDTEVLTCKAKERKPLRVQGRGMMPCERQVIRWRKLRPPECEFPDTRLPERCLLCHPPALSQDSANKTERQELS